MPLGRTFAFACAVLVCGVSFASPAFAGEPVAVATDVPFVSSVAVSPSHVDVSTSPAVVSIAATVANASSVSVAVGSAPAAPLALTSGVPSSGTWSGAVAVPGGTAHGTLPVHVVAVDASGVTAVADASVVVDDAAPAVPTGVAAAAVAPGSLLVGWTAPAPNGGSDVTSYAVSAEPVSPSDVVPPVVLAGADARSATVAGLTVGARYVVRVAATNAVGAGPTGVADAVTALGEPGVPDAPADVAAVPADRALAVSWAPPVSDGGSDVLSYEVRAVPRGGLAVAPPVVTAPASPVVVSGLANGETYDVSVVAVNAIGAGLPATSSAAPRTAASVPLGVSVTAGNASAIVRWSPPASNGGADVTSYVVTSSPPGLSVTVPATVGGVTMAPLTNGVPVSFTVAAVNAAGYGAPAVSGFVTPRLPGRLSVVTQPAPVVTYGSATTVVASLLSDAGVPLPGQRVEIMAQVRPSTVWRGVAAGLTGTDGRVTLRTALPATSALRVHHPVNAVGAGDAIVRSVAVAPRVTASASSTRIRVGMTLTVSGSIAPAHPIGSVVYLQRAVSGAWQTVSYGRMVSTTAYRVGWRPAGVGTYSLRVVKPADGDHTSGVSRSWSESVAPESAADIARAILANRRITLETTHDSGVRDLATVRQNIIDVSYGRLAHRSSYENAPGGYTSVDIRLLRALRRMGQLGTVTISEIAGGSHAVGSTHYSGRGLDISWVNGRHVAAGSGYRLALDVCHAYGAVRIFHPAYDPYGGHGNHVHCEW